MDDQLNSVLSELKKVKDSGVHAGVITSNTADIVSRIKKVVVSIESCLDDPAPSNVFDTKVHLKTETYAPQEEVKEEKKRGPKPKK